MAVQVFIDESGQGVAPERHYVMSALVSDAENWAQFSTKWAECLSASEPRIRAFKYAKFCNSMTRAKRSKLEKLARIVNDHVNLVSPVLVDVPGHADTIGALDDKDTRHPYFIGAHVMIEKAAHALWNYGVRE